MRSMKLRYIFLLVASIAAFASLVWYFTPPGIPAPPPGMTGFSRYKGASPRLPDEKNP